MLGSHYPIWEIKTELDDDLVILEFEMLMNYFMLKWLEYKDIDQVNWSGKEEQKFLYDVEKYNSEDYSKVN